MRRLHCQAHRHAYVRRAGAGVPAHRRQGQAGTRVLRARILVADDDPASAELLVAFLESQGFEVAIAPDGNLALEMGTSGEYELVILDVHMPLYDGVEILQMLRMRHVLHPIKVIALTADHSDSVRFALEATGVDSYFTKPVDLALLRDEVARLTAA
ncbi:MAG: response regulator [Chloroflexi bacterium]|nr:MAG: response regulator [Chloroflexota bacterium]